MPVPPGTVPAHPGRGCRPGQGRSGQDSLDDLGASGLVGLDRPTPSSAYQLHPRRLAPQAHRPTTAPQTPSHRRSRLTSHHPRHRITTHILTKPSPRHKTPLHEWCIHHQNPPTRTTKPGNRYARSCLTITIPMRSPASQVARSKYTHVQCLLPQRTSILYPYQPPKEQSAPTIHSQDLRLDSP